MEEEKNSGEQDGRAAIILLDRASRATRGKRLSKLLDDEIQQDELFWSQDALKEEDEDDNYQEEAEIADEFDSDFDQDVSLSFKLILKSIIRLTNSSFFFIFLGAWTWWRTTSKRRRWKNEQKEAADSSWENVG